MATDMRGMRRVRHLLAEFYATNLPPYVVALGAVNDDPLPAPVQYLPHAAPVVDRSPIISIGGVRVKSVRRLEHTDTDGIEFAVTYVTRTFIWILADGMEDATDVRDDLTAAVRTLLLDRQTLDLAGVSAVVDEDTVVEEYSEVEPTGRGERYIAGAYVECDMTVHETVERGPSGTVATVEVEAVPHPAL